jgi:mannose-6-phosphate isomerase-like protein (cupin superfamily)
MSAPEKINLGEKFDLFTDQWSPKIVGVVDDYDVKIVKLQGEFVWHAHDNDDELFLVINGHMKIEFRDETVSLGVGEMIVIPKGVEHRPQAEEECQALLFERKGVINTGNEQSSLTAKNLERI